jgi:hypothetical protein
VQNENFLYSDDQLMARLKFFVGVCLALTLTGIVFVVLYSLIFVTQPLNAMSPIDQKFFEMIIPIATFLTGTLSGIMLAGGKDDAEIRKQAMTAANREVKVSPMPVDAQSAPMQRTTNQPAIITPQGEVFVGYGGKLAPVQPQQPEL